MEPTPDKKPLHFIRQIITDDLASGKHTGIVTRFPPEPNGYLHIGHAKSICLNFGLAREFGGRCHLRFDDTNPAAEEVEFVESIQEDVKWLGQEWGEHLYFASDYFERMIEAALFLIREGKAYACELSQEEFKEYRGVPSRPGKEPPGRSRSVEENLEIFGRMRSGELPEGSFVLRARIDMASPNIHMRDPAIYRIKKAHHHRTGDAWCVYPMYDYAHCLSDAFEAITHSLCTLEFEVHRPLYDWILEAVGTTARPRQIEFARLNLSYTVMSKRLLQELVRDGRVSGWDDPRMPTIAGLRRRGVTPAAIRAFCEEVGITKYDGLTDVSLLEHHVRQDLNKVAERRLGVVHPLRVVITNYPEDAEEYFEAENNPEDPASGTRRVPFSREIFIDRDDFMADPPPKYFRLAPGREVRLKYACYITCTGVESDPVSGEPTTLLCTWDPESRGASTPDNRKVKGTIHWVSARHARQVTLRLFDRLFTVPEPTEVEGQHFTEFLNPEARKDVTAWVEPSLVEAPPHHFQLERVGYFCPDAAGTASAPLFNRTIGLKDSWAKIAPKG